MRFHKYKQLDRAELDQGWGWITFLARGERKVITFRQLEILWFHLWRGNPLDIKEDELQRVGLQSLKMDTLPQGQRLPNQEPSAEICHKALANTFFARKALGQ
ncbi:unnamed protein product [Microthlaspi erraticum]|uniref:Uncharacterized protein n=1 Tax=Microthlaspi erraticum TaxID=1685480 RepID=A0A6D2JK91_9BRAS|nr:unnamed protein product [Microthlaspi erraticum]